jgi:cobalamin biosynthetic protein CobC
MDSRQPYSEEAAALRYHGGNINAARRLFPEAPEPWIDLSTGINAVPYPVDGIAPEAWTRLPDARALDALESAARAAYGVSRSVGVVAAAGAQSLIQWLPRIFPARRVGVLGFTYREHETSWRASGADVVTVRSLADLAAFDVGLVVNPNNPDGRRFAPEDLAEIAGALSRRGGRLIIDEAFMDLLERQDSLIPHLPAPGAIVLRSFGKAYGLAGVRLGFAAASMDDCARVRGALGPWPVSGPAIEIGRRALADDSWLAATALRLREEARLLDGLLQSVDLEIAGGTLLFRLVQVNQAPVLFSRLCLAGILTRPFVDRPDWLRFGIPHAPAEWMRLKAVLRSL